jgi:hypothetical protein
VLIDLSADGRLPVLIDSEHLFQVLIHPFEDTERLHNVSPSGGAE